MLVLSLPVVVAVVVVVTDDCNRRRRRCRRVDVSVVMSASFNIDVDDDDDDDDTNKSNTNCSRPLTRDDCSTLEATGSVLPFRMATIKAAPSGVDNDTVLLGCADMDGANDTEGVMDGEPVDGDNDGCCDGKTEGAAVDGVDVGIALPVIVGMALSIRVGMMLGRVDVDGSVDGKTLGCWKDGNKDGPSLGATDGGSVTGAVVVVATVGMGVMGSRSACSSSMTCSVARVDK